MAVDKDNIIEIIRDSGSPFWTIYTTSQFRAKIVTSRTFSIFDSFPSMTAEEEKEFAVDMETSMEELRKKISYLNTGTYVIKYYRDYKNKSKGFSTQEFRITAEAPPVAINGTPNAQMPFMGGTTDMIGYVNEKIEAALAKKRLEELEAENEELRKDVQDPSGLKTQMSNIMGYLSENAPHVYIGIAQGLMNLIGPKTAPTVMQGAGMNDAPIPSTPPQKKENETQQKLELMTEEEKNTFEEELEKEFDQVAPLIARLKAVDPNYIKTLSVLIEKVEQKPQLLNMIGML